MNSKLIPSILIIALLLPLSANAQTSSKVMDTNTQGIEFEAPQISFFERLLRIFFPIRYRAPIQEIPVTTTPSPLPTPAPSQAQSKSQLPTPPKNTFLELGSLRQQSPYSKAFGANDKKQIVGMTMTDTKESGQAFIWENGLMRELTSLNNKSHAVAQSINSSGVVVGYAGDGPNESSPNRAVVWTNNKVTRLPMPKGFYESHAYDINESGDITGDVSNRTEVRAVVWRNNIPQVLGTLDGTTSVGLRVTSNGDVLGNYQTTQGVTNNFIWSNNQMQKYSGELLPNPAEQWAHTFGKFSFEGNLIDANEYLAENSPWQISNIERVYPNGDLVGFATDQKLGGTFAIYIHAPSLTQSPNP